MMIFTGVAGRTSSLNLAELFDRQCQGRQIQSILIAMRAEMVNNLRGIAIDPTESEYGACVDRFSGQIQS